MIEGEMFLWNDCNKDIKVNKKSKIPVTYLGDIRRLNPIDFQENEKN